MGKSDSLAPNKSVWIAWIKWSILVLCYSFLAYKLVTFSQYPELLAHWKQLPISRFWWLAAVFLLLPFNWLFESIKWKMMTKHIQKLTLKSSVKAVLAGISTGFFTPNRVGELVGRVMFLDSEHRKAGVTLSLLNSLTQNLIMTVCGIPACILFFAYTTDKVQPNSVYYLVLLAICLIGFGVLYFFLPQLSNWFKRSRHSLKINQFTDCLSDLKEKELVGIMLISLARYAIFCIQFFLMLRFFGVELSSWQALIAIPTNYLFVTFTPSLAFSEAAVRSSFAVMTIGIFSGQVVNIALAGMCIWMVNFVVPMLVGSAIMVRHKS